METALHVTTRVLPGNKIEITSPELREGESIEVFLILPRTSAPAPRSALEIIDDLKGHRLFQTAEEVDRYVQGERDSWQS